MPSRLAGRLKKIEGKLRPPQPMHVIRTRPGQDEGEARRIYEQEQGAIKEGAFIIYLVKFAEDGQELNPKNELQQEIIPPKPNATFQGENVQPRQSLRLLDREISTITASLQAEGLSMGEIAHKLKELEKEPEQK